MGTGSQLDDDTTLAAMPEVEAMVAVLEGRHGAFAADVADFFATFHSLKGDKARSWAWADVAERARNKTEERLNDY